MEIIVVSSSQELCENVVHTGQRQTNRKLWRSMLLLLLLSHISRVRLCATPSLGFSRQEHWSGLPFPSPMHGKEKGKWSCSVVSDSSWPHGLQPTRLLHPWDSPGKELEWGAIAFSEEIGTIIYYLLNIIEETAKCRESALQQSKRRWVSNYSIFFSNHSLLLLQRFVVSSVPARRHKR